MTRNGVARVRDPFFLVIFRVPALAGRRGVGTGGLVGALRLGFSRAVYGSGLEGWSGDGRIVAFLAAAAEDAIRRFLDHFREQEPQV